MSDSQPRLPNGQFLTERFPVLTYGQTPTVDTQDWQFEVWGHGLAGKINWDWDEFNALGSHETVRDMHCVTTWSRYDNKWQGVPVESVWSAIEANLEDDIKPGAVMLHCYGGYTTNLLLDDFLNPDNLFASHHDGQPLTIPHGGPMRFVCHHLYAWKSAKWISGIELLEQDDRGFWERHGYHLRGDPWGEERYSYQE